MSNNSDSTEPTVESLTKKKEDFLSHGLQDTALGDAVDRKTDEKHEELARQRELVEAKVAVQQAKQAGVEDPAVEALAQTVEELSEDTEAAALVEDPETTEARERIAELEALANSTEGAAGKSFEQKAAALRSKHGIEKDAPNKYSAEALGKADEDTEDPEAEALAAYQDRKTNREIDERMSDEDRKMLSNYKTVRNQASSEKIREKYQQKIEDLRNKYA